VVDHLSDLSPERARAIGLAAYRRAKARHTYAHRAELVQRVLEGKLAVVGAGS
jgi:spore maturation protein CgeB